jgi:hypothetical protein
LGVWGFSEKKTPKPAPNAYRQEADRTPTPPKP